jgi:hypothetical protein
MNARSDCFGHYYLRWRTFSTAKKRDLKTCKVPVWLTVLTKTGTQTVNIEGKSAFPRDLVNKTVKVGTKEFCERLA